MFCKLDVHVISGLHVDCFMFTGWVDSLAAPPGENDPQADEARANPFDRLCQQGVSWRKSQPHQCGITPPEPA